jgi:hypothetical protein
MLRSRWCQGQAGAAEGLWEIYFRDGGRRPHGLGIESTDIEHFEFDL